MHSFNDNFHETTSQATADFFARAAYLSQAYFHQKNKLNAILKTIPSGNEERLMLARRFVKIHKKWLAIGKDIEKDLASLPDHVKERFPELENINFAKDQKKFASFLANATQKLDEFKQVFELSEVVQDLYNATFHHKTNSPLVYLPKISYLFRTLNELRLPIPPDIYRYDIYANINSISYSKLIPSNIMLHHWISSHQLFVTAVRKLHQKTNAWLESIAYDQGTINPFSDDRFKDIYSAFYLGYSMCDLFTLMSVSKSTQRHIINFLSNPLTLLRVLEESSKQHIALFLRQYIETEHPNPIYHSIRKSILKYMRRNKDGLALTWKIFLSDDVTKISEEELNVAEVYAREKHFRCAAATIATAASCKVESGFDYYINLSGKNLDSINHYDFEYAKLKNVTIQKLKHGCFAYADLRGANLSCRGGFNFKYSDLRNVNFNRVLIYSSTSLAHAQLDESFFAAEFENSMDALKKFINEKDSNNFKLFLRHPQSKKKDLDRLFKRAITLKKEDLNFLVENIPALTKNQLSYWLRNINFISSNIRSSHSSEEDTLSSPSVEDMSSSSSVVGINFYGIEGLRIILKECNKLGIDINTLSPPAHRLLDAAIDAYNTDVISLVIKHGAYVNIADEHGRAPIHNVVRKSNGACLKALLESGVSPNMLDTKGFTPLFYALDKDIAQLLLQYSAYINHIDKDYQTALDRIFQYRGNCYKLAAFLFKNGAKFKYLKYNSYTVTNYVGKPGFDIFNQTISVNNITEELNQLQQNIFPSSDSQLLVVDCLRNELDSGYLKKKLTIEEVLEILYLAKSHPLFNSHNQGARFFHIPSEAKSRLERRYEDYICENMRLNKL